MSHEFPSGLMGSKSFLSSFIEGGESVFKSREEGFTKGGVGVGFISIEDREWRLLGGAMQCRVMVELSG